MAQTQADHSNTGTLVCVAYCLACKKIQDPYECLLNGTQRWILFSVYSCGIMSDKSELKAELERKKQRLAQIREEKKRKEEERKKKEVC